MEAFVEDQNATGRDETDNLAHVPTPSPFSQAVDPRYTPLANSLVNFIFNILQYGQPTLGGTVTVTEQIVPLKVLPFKQNRLSPRVDKIYFL